MWITPKTNWKAVDYFNIQDYNRIKNNLNHIRSMALQLYNDFPYATMGDDKTTYTEYFYADEINLFEGNLDRINKNTFPRNLGEMSTFYDNQPFIDWQELNRLENGIYTIYQGLHGQLLGRRRLSFKLGRRMAV